MQKESNDRICLVSLANRTQGVPWFALQGRWLAFPANIKTKYLALLVELNLGCWPGWTFHPTTRSIISYHDSEIPQQSAHAVWTFVHLTRVASPLCHAKLGKLRGKDWVYECDRIQVTIERVHVPAWLSNDPEMYYVASILWKHIPLPTLDKKRFVKLGSVERILFPIMNAYPRLSSQIQTMHQEFASVLAPAQMISKPLYDLVRPGPEWVLGDVPSMTT